MSSETTATDNSSGDANRSQPNSPPKTFKEHVMRDPSAAICCVARLVVILFSVSTVFPVFASLHTSYKIALQASLVVFSVRLAERRRQNQIPVISLQFLNYIFKEDSGHYLFYCGYYYQYYPTAFILIPLVIYAIMQSSKYLHDAKQFFSAGMQSFIVSVHNKVATSQDSMYRFIAASEIFLMLIVTLNTIFLNGGLLTPFFHYFFLKWRYSSTRNRYVRVVFYEMRMAAQMLIQRPSCPQFIRNLVIRIIDSLVYLAPTVPTQ